MLTVNADTHLVMRQFHKAENEKRPRVIVRLEDYIHWLGADTETAAGMMTWENMPRKEKRPKRGVFA